MWRGVPYEYATWTTVRRESFIMRRVVAAWGWTHGAFRLFQLRRHGRLDVAYLWFWAPRPSVQRYVLLALLHVLRVPVVMELNERPWSLCEELTLWERRLSPLLGVSGVVSISAFLTEWARGEAPRRRVRVIEVPIVVDVNEQSPAQYPHGEPLVVFAGSPAYDETIRFIYAAMKRVWMGLPQCRLVVTGTSPRDTAAKWLLEESGGLGSDVRVTLAGYLSRAELLQLYARAHVLLIPLFDDDRSRARFPTKIGEYMAAARPVVTTAIGEANRYFVDNVNAVVCSPGDSALYGDRIVALLRNPELAASIGCRGRELAEARFHYAVHSEALYCTFASLADIADQE
jgi:glycosyltransferase involved in cell wall biosynthesis